MGEIGAADQKLHAIPSERFPGLDRQIQATSGMGEAWDFVIPSERFRWYVGDGGSRGWQPKVARNPLRAFPLARRGWGNPGISLSPQSISAGS